MLQTREPRTAESVLGQWRSAGHFQTRVTALPRTTHVVGQLLAVSPPTPSPMACPDTRQVAMADCFKLSNTFAERLSICKRVTGFPPSACARQGEESHHRRKRLQLAKFPHVIKRSSS